MKVEIKEYISGGAAAVTNIALTFPRSEVHRELQQCLTSIPTNFVRNLSNLEKQMFCVTSNQNI